MHEQLVNQKLASNYDLMLVQEKNSKVLATQNVNHHSTFMTQDQHNQNRKPKPIWRSSMGAKHKRTGTMDTKTMTKNLSKNMVDDASFIFANTPVASQMIIAQHDYLKNLTQSLFQKDGKSLPKSKVDLVPQQI